MTHESYPENALFGIDEVRRRMPALQLIDDAAIRSEVATLTRHSPEYFWIRPGSYEGYHNGERHGLWHHTLKLSSVIETLFPTYQQQFGMADVDKDRAHAAAILHDQRKNGVALDSENTSEYHPEVMAALIREESTLDELVAGAVETHMGGWGPARPPVTKLSELVHTADMLASDDDHAIPIPGPVPAELSSIATRRPSEYDD